MAPERPRRTEVARNRTLSLLTSWPVPWQRRQLPQLLTVDRGAHRSMTVRARSILQDRTRPRCMRTTSLVSLQVGEGPHLVRTANGLRSTRRVEAEKVSTCSAVRHWQALVAPERPRRAVAASTTTIAPSTIPPMPWLHRHQPPDSCRSGVPRAMAYRPQATLHDRASPRSMRTTTLVSCRWARRAPGAPLQ